MHPVLHLLLWPLALFGLVALALVVAIAQPLKPPPPLASIHAGAMKISRDGLPELTRFQARDGTWLAYRLYPAANGGREKLAILAHGSSASSDEMHMIAKALAAAGIVAVAIDARGHGASGTRGDIGYIGELDDDMADLVAHLGKDYPNAHLMMIGHSSGGGFVSRFAGEQLGEKFDRFILLAPYLGYRAPTNRPNEGGGQWVNVDMPRVVALAILWRTLGVDWAQSLPVLAFANEPEARPFVTPSYSFRLMANYAAPTDWQAPFAGRGEKFVVIVGADDELMNAPAYKDALAPYSVPVEIVPGVDHMGVVYQPAAIERIVAAAQR